MRFRPMSRLPFLAKAVSLGVVIGAPLIFTQDLFAGPGTTPWSITPPSMAIDIATGRCTRLENGQGHDTLVNTCNVCVTARLEHRRPVGDVPSNRDFRMPANAEMPLSFRGGKTRIMTEELCDGRQVEQPAGAAQCLSLFTSETGITAAVNSCATCRTATVERMTAGGRSTNEAVAVGAKSYVPINPKGAQHARLIGDQPCR